jgi:hypothetical protein
MVNSEKIVTYLMLRAYLDQKKPVAQNIFMGHATHEIFTHSVEMKRYLDLDI